MKERREKGKKERSSEGDRHSAWVQGKIGEARKREEKEGRGKGGQRSEKRKRNEKEIGRGKG